MRQPRSAVASKREHERADGDRLSLRGQTYTSTTGAHGDALLTLSGDGTVSLANFQAVQVNAGCFA